MTPYSPERPRGRLVKTDTGYKVEWSAVAKQDEPFNPARVQFRKDDDGGTAISVKDRLKASKKRAKQDAKNRKKANASAEAARAGLAKGESEVKDPIVTIAKAMVENNYTPRVTGKAAFYKALVELSEKQRRPGRPYADMTKEVAFAKFATTDPTGQLLMRAHKMADGADWSGVDEPDPAGMPETSAAYDTLAEEARRLQHREAKSGRQVDFPVAFSFSRAASARPDLMKADREAHFAKVAKAYGVR